VTCQDPKRSAGRHILYSRISLRLCHVETARHTASYRTASSYGGNASGNLGKKVLYRASDFTARDIFALAFFIEQGEAQFLNDKTYRDKLEVISRRIKRSSDELRKSFVSIASTGYKVDYNHCVDVVISQFVSEINSGIQPTGSDCSK
jgi:hypothetical protein